MAGSGAILLEHRSEDEQMLAAQSSQKNNRRGLPRLSIKSVIKNKMNG